MRATVLARFLFVPGSYDKAAFEPGKMVFNGSGKCATCHVPPLYTEPGYNMHAPSEIGVDAFQADRSRTHMYRTAPLAGLWTHQKGGFFHDGRFATLLDVVNHYDTQYLAGRIIVGLWPLYYRQCKRGTFGA
jgi:cytochrome c peroxidase